MNALQNIDYQLFLWLNSWVGVLPFFDWVIVFRATYSWYVVMVVVAAFVAATVFERFRRHRNQNVELFLFAFASALVARFGVTELIRFFYNRPRPFEVLEGVRQLVDHSGGGSFPSGHASLAFAVAASVSFYYPKTSLLFFAAALSISMNRVAAGVHWPSDILGGAAVGVTTAFALRLLLKKLWTRNESEPTNSAHLKVNN